MNRPQKGWGRGIATIGLTAHDSPISEGPGPAQDAGVVTVQFNCQRPIDCRSVHSQHNGTPQNPATWKHPTVRMPDPLRKPWKQNGSILSAGNATIALVLAASAYGFIGVIALVCAAAVLVAVELIRFSVAIESRLDAATKRAQELDVESVQLKVDLGTSRNEESRLVELLSKVRERLQMDDPSLERVQSVLTHAQDAIDIVLRHRSLAEAAGNPVWAVIEARLTDDGDVVMTSDIRPQAIAEIAKEPLIIWGPERESLAVEVVGTSEGRVHVSCLLERLPQDLANELNDYGTTSPVGYELRLQGLSAPGYANISTEQLSTLRTSLGASIQTVSDTRNATRSDHRP